MRPYHRVSCRRGSFVSIHASVKDATPEMIIALTDMGFNPRICKRCDFGSATKQGDLPVSIHASVKDATIPLSFERIKCKFQSTHL